MPIIRIDHNRENPFVQLNKTVLFDNSISFKARGFWAYCLGHPNNWHFSVNEISKKTKEGKRVIYSMINELMECGYVLRFQSNCINGQTGFKQVEYVFLEFKIEKDKINDYISEFKKSLPRCGFARAQNAPLLIKSINKKKQQNKKEQIPPTEMHLAPVVVPFQNLQNKPKKISPGIKQTKIPNCREQTKIPNCLESVYGITQREKEDLAKRFTLTELEMAATLINSKKEHIANPAGYIISSIKHGWINSKTSSECIEDNKNKIYNNFRQLDNKKIVKKIRVDSSYSTTVTIDVIVGIDYVMIGAKTFHCNQKDFERRVVQCLESHVMGSRIENQWWVGVIGRLKDLMG